MRARPHLHFIGIGGIGVSAVARLAIERGYPVSGSDVRRSQLTESMERLGARVHIGHRGENLDGVEVVVVSTAIPAENVELVAAAERGIPIRHRSELLAMLMADTTSVGVTGTHGKGTTSAMIVRILDAAGGEPGFMIGGLLLDYGVNARGGGGRYMVAEVDESDGTHRNVPTRLMVCNFLDADHLNYYADHDAIIRSMAEVIDGHDETEHVFINVDCPGNRRLLSMIGKPVTTYGVETEDADYRGTIRGRGQLPITFDVVERGEALGTFTLPLPGRYNVVNALGALSVARHLGIDEDAIRSGLSGFHGLENRFTIVEAGGVTIVKDYNSHPTAMRKVLESARDLSTGRVVSVFKPYRYTLIHYLKDEYATAFRGSDEVIITTMYAANEDPIPGIDTQFVVDMLRRQGHRVTFIEDQDRITSYLEGTVVPGDQVLFFGGDDFFRMADAWAEERRGGGK